MKKLNQKGFSHHLVMFAILALVLGAMGFAGYRVYQGRNIDAKAASNTLFTISSTQTKLSACRVIDSLKTSQSFIHVRVDNSKSGAQWKLDVKTPSRTQSLAVNSNSIMSTRLFNGVAVGSSTAISFTLTGVNFGPSVKKITIAASTLLTC